MLPASPTWVILPAGQVDDYDDEMIRICRLLACTFRTVTIPCGNVRCLLIMITPAMPRAGSIQKNVLLMPPQLRLPGERLPGT